MKTHGQYGVIKICYEILIYLFKYEYRMIAKLDTVSWILRASKYKKKTLK